MKEKKLKKIGKFWTIGLIIPIISCLLTSCSQYNRWLDGTGLFFNKSDNEIGEDKLANIMLNWIDGESDHQVLFIGFDGCRADAVAKYIIWNKDSTESPLVKYQKQQLALGFCGGDDDSQETSTSPGWTTLLTGEWGKINGVTTNYGKTQLKSGHHTIMYNLADEGESVSYCSSQYKWDVTWKTDFPNPEKYDFYQDPDTKPSYESITNKCISQIDGSDNNFVILDCCDNVGHSTGFSPNNTEYMEAVKVSDNYAKKIIDKKIEKMTDENIDPKNLLVIITTDHGGIRKGHGHFSQEEKTTWFATNRPIFL